MWPDQPPVETITLRIQVEGTATTKRLRGKPCSTEFELFCGEGEQLVKWLGLAACQRLALGLPGGKLRNVEGRQQVRGCFYQPMAVLSEDGTVLNPGMRLKDRFKDMDKCRVVLQELKDNFTPRIQINQRGEPEKTKFFEEAFQKGKQAPNARMTRRRSYMQAHMFAPLKTNVSVGTSTHSPLVLFPWQICCLCVVFVFRSCPLISNHWFGCTCMYAACGRTRSKSSPPLSTTTALRRRQSTTWTRTQATSPRCARARIKT